MNDINTIKKEMLKEVAAMYKGKYETVRDEMNRKVIGIIKTKLLGTVNDETTEFVGDETCSHFTIYLGAVHNGEGRRIDYDNTLTLSYRADWHTPEDNTKHLTVNDTTCGGFGIGDKLVRYFKMLGVIADNLEQMEQEIASLDWETHDMLLTKCRAAHEELRDLNAREKVEEVARKQAQFEQELSQLKEDDKIQVCTRSVRRRNKDNTLAYGKDGEALYDTVPYILTIQKVTKKTVVCKEHYGTTYKKESLFPAYLKGDCVLVINK